MYKNFYQNVRTLCFCCLAL